MCGVWATLSGGLGCPRPQASRASDDQARSLEAKRKWQNPQKRSAFSLSSIGRHSHEKGQEWKQNPTSRLSDNDGQFTSPLHDSCANFDCASLHTDWRKTGSRTDGQTTHVSLASLGCLIGGACRSDQHADGIDAGYVHTHSTVSVRLRQHRFPRLVNPLQAACYSVA